MACGIHTKKKKRKPDRDGILVEEVNYPRQCLLLPMRIDEYFLLTTSRLSNCNYLSNFMLILTYASRRLKLFKLIIQANRKNQTECPGSGLDLMLFNFSIQVES